jgi:hypothetical protein
VSRVVDLGSGVTARLFGVNKDAVNWAGERIYPADVPDVVGAIIEFPGGCDGVIHWWALPGGDEKLWTLHSLDPLHVEPSVQCTVHPEHHGFIRNGRWEQA